MRKIVVFLAGLAFMLAGGAVQADPMFVPLSEHTMALGVGIHAEPMGRTYAFSTDDIQAVSWIMVWRDLKPHQVEWRWYYPEGRTYSRSFGVIPPIDGPACLWGEPVWSCLKIRGHDAARMPGIWKVDVFIDYRKVVTEYFTINGPLSCL